MARRADELLATPRFIDREHRLELLDIDLDRRLRATERFASLGGDHHDRLTDERDDVFGKQNLVFDDRAEEVVRQIGVRIERHHPRHTAGCGGVERADAPVRHRRPEEIDEQLVARERNVVDVNRFAGNVPARGVVWNVLADDGHGFAAYAHSFCFAPIKI